MTDCRDYSQNKCGSCTELGGANKMGCYSPINRETESVAEVPCSVGLSDIDPYNLECLAMAIVNHTNDKTGADVKTRQSTNDENFDYAIKTIKVFLTENGR